MNRKILIIGSGPSGIATATKLIEFGFQNVTVLEANDRIGGRIHTIQFGENVVDLGAQWCHGEKGNVVYEIAKKYQDDIFASTGDLYKNLFSCVKSNKELIPKEVSIKLNVIIDQCTRTEEAEKELSKFKGSYEEFLNKRFNDKLEKPENSDIDKKTAKQFLDFYKKFKCSLDACDTLNDLSASGELSYWECEGDPVLNWKGKGYITILKILMNSTNDKPYGVLENKIKFNKKVEEICWKRNDEGKIWVQCQDNNRIYADHIICTIPLGVLKEKYLKLFTPTLPSRKIHAIEGLGMGNVDKIFIEFEKPFWPDAWPGMCLLWEDNDLDEIRQRSDRWIEDVFGLYPVDFQPNILCGWIVGANGRRMESASDEEVLNGIMFLLKKFSTWDITEPKNFVRSLWYNNPNARGSYSFRSMKTEELNTSAADLAYPLTNDDDDDVNGEPLLQFAGEATHDHYYSTVHGAIESGWREANRLNNFYNKPKSHL